MSCAFMAVLLLSTSPSFAAGASPIVTPLHKLGKTPQDCLPSLPDDSVATASLEAQSASFSNLFDRASGACAVGAGGASVPVAAGMTSSTAVSPPRALVHGRGPLSVGLPAASLDDINGAPPDVFAPGAVDRSPSGFVAQLWGSFSAFGDSLLNVLPMPTGDWFRRLVDWYGLIGVRPGDWGGYIRRVEKDGGARRYSKNNVEFLVDGENVLPRLFDAIDGAKTSIDLQSFQYEVCAYESGPKNVPCDRSADVGWQVGERLAAKARQGVRVRLLMDQFGTEDGADRKELDDFLTFLSSSGVEWAFHKKPLLVDHLDHRKLYVFDGRVGFVGGMNIGNDYQVYWHDQLARIEGPAVRGLQEAFDEKWIEAAKTARSREEPALLPDPAPVPGGIDLWLVLHEGGFWNDKHIKRDYLQAIATAQREIDIADPYLSDPDVLGTLRKAALRGVKVRIVVPAHNDQPLLQRAARGYFVDLVAAGVEVYEYSGRPMAHDKVAVVDGRWATFGSSNLDNRSLGFNDEINVFLLDPRPDGVVRDIETELFDPDVRASRRLTAADLDATAWPTRLRQWADTLLSFLI